MRAGRRAVVLLALLVMTGAWSGCGERGEPAAGATAASSAAPAGHADAAAPAEFKLCEHRVPAELCTRCNPELVEVFKDQDDWCKEHGVPESQCLECHPELTFTKDSAAAKDWCKEHSLPESKCTKCNPNLIAGFLEAGNYCREHGFPKDVCPYCHPELVRAAGQVPPAEASLTTKVRLASAGTAAEAGIETRKVQQRLFARTLDVVGQLAFDQNKLAQLAARDNAMVVEVKADIGDKVAAGQPLVVLTSASVGEGQAQLASALAQVAAARANVERESGLARKGISPQRSVEEARAELARAQAEYDAARSSLGAAGASTSDSGGRYVLSSPVDGTVVARNAVAGRSIGGGQILMEVADVSVFWALLDVPEAEAGDVHAGQKVALTLEGVSAEALKATVTRVGSSVDPATRTVQARVELANPEGRLKSGTFVRATIAVSDEHQALLVPRDAVQKAEGRNLVFVKKEAALFQPVTVQLGGTSGGEVEVTGALAAGDEVVTTGAFLLKTEILKDSIGAGCCEEDE